MLVRYEFHSSDTIEGANKVKASLANGIKKSKGAEHRRLVCGFDWPCCWILAAIGRDWAYHWSVRWHWHDLHCFALWLAGAVMALVLYPNHQYNSLPADDR